MERRKKITKLIEKEAKKYFVGASGCHDWTHVERVRDLSRRIGQAEKADLFVLELASLLHDIGRNKEMKNKGSFCHAKKGAKIAKRILNRYRVAKDKIDNIVHCIETHRWRDNNQPKTLEAKIIFDADKIDSIGAVGIGRDFLFAGNAGSNCLYTGNEKKLAKSKINYCFTKEDSAFLEYEVKLKHVKNKILTREGKKIAKNRHKYMVNFFNRFEKEVEGLL